jgi:hypothetical protein
MAQPNGEGGQSATPPAGQSTGTETTGQPAASTDGTAGQSAGTVTPEATPTEETVSRAEFDKLRNQLSAADQNRTKAEAELKAIRDKDLPELDKAKSEATEAQARADRAEAKLKEVLLQNAFLTDNTHKWRNPASALKLLDMSKITISSDHTVTGMKDAVTALAKSDAYLLEPDKPETPATPPGTQPGNNGGQGTGAPALKGMESRIPALRGRTKTSRAQ